MMHHAGMANGKLVNIANPDPSQIDPEDIVRGLSHINRYAGQTPRPYSVGQHTVAIMAYIDLKHPEFDKQQRQAALIHDFPEYVLTDVPNPLKKLLFPWGSYYGTLTELWEDAICNRFECFGSGGYIYRTVFNKYIAEIDVLAYHSEWAVMELGWVRKGHTMITDHEMEHAVEKAWELTPRQTRQCLYDLIERELM